MKAEWNMKIKDEVVKQLDVGFFDVTDYSKWLADNCQCLKKMERS